MESNSSDCLPDGYIFEDRKYRIIEKLGSGGFGITYKAEHLQTKGLVAIKEYFPISLVTRDIKYQPVYLPSKNNSKDRFQRGLERFLEEAKVLEKLDVPQIVRIRDYFEANRTAFLVMSFIQGESLRMEMRRNHSGILPERRIDWIMSQLVIGLSIMHTQGIYHLDIKPENVMIQKHGNIETVTLVDLGAAQIDSPEGTSAEVLTEPYAPLEIVKKKQVGPESDIYELGVMLYEMVTGNRPPTARERDSGAFITWQPDKDVGMWEKLLEDALGLEKNTRPNNIEQWWDSRNRSMSFGKTVRVDLQGNHQFNSIQEALEAAKTRAINYILVNPGTYTESLYVADLSNLKIEGKEGVIIQNSDENTLSVQECQHIEFKNLVFRREPASLGSVITVSNSKSIKFTSCEATGAIGKLHAGLEVNSSQVIVDQGEFKNNSIGIYAHSNAMGEVNSAKCYDNQIYGIWISGIETKVDLQWNRCDRNGVGIFYSHEASGELHHNECNDNKEYGFVIANKQSGRPKFDGRTNHSYGLDVPVIFRGRWPQHYVK